MAMDIKATSIILDGVITADKIAAVPTNIAQTVSFVQVSAEEFVATVCQRSGNFARQGAFVYFSGRLQKRTESGFPYQSIDMIGYIDQLVFDETKYWVHPGISA